MIDCDGGVNLTIRFAEVLSADKDHRNKVVPATHNEAATAEMCMVDLRPDVKFGSYVAAAQECYHSHN